MKSTNIILSIVLCLFTLCQAFGQSLEDEISISANWLKGDTYRFSIHNSEQSNEELVDSFIYIARLTVIDATEEGYTLQWLIEKNQKMPDEFKGYEEIYNKNTPKEFVYTTTKSGVFLEWKNETEVKEKMTQFFKEYAEAYGKDNEMGEAYIQMMKETMLESLQTEGLRKRILPEADYIHGFFGRVVKRDEPTPYTRFDSNGANDSLKIVGAYSFSEGKVPIEIVLEDKASADEAYTQDFLRARLEGMGLSSKEQKQHLKKAIFDLKYAYECTYDVERSFPKRIQHSTNLRVEIVEYKQAYSKTVTIQLLEK